MTESDSANSNAEGGALRALLKLVPGYGGYTDEKHRRGSDLRHREWLVERLERGKQGLDRYMRVLVDSVQLDAIAPVDRLRQQTDQLCGRIRGAARGDRFFTTFGGEPDRIEQLYAHDLALVDQVAAAADAMESLGDSAANAEESLSAIAGHLALLADMWDTREDMLKEA